jgi:NTP pyrophosphatase (non-canonical NTP hydrolase)
MPNRWDLSECAREAVAFRDERGFKEFNDPKNLATAISIEAAELEEKFLWKGREEFGEIDPERMCGIADELADVVIYTLIFAHDAKIDLRAAVDARIEKNREKYPLPEI